MSTSSSNNNNLAEYLSFVLKQQQQCIRSNSNDDSKNDDSNNGRHALNQLLESKLGNEITTSAQRLVTAVTNDHNNKNNNNNDVVNNISSCLLEEEITKLMSTSSFQEINAQIIKCPLSLLLPSSKQQTTTITSDDENDDRNKTTTLKQLTTTNNAVANKPTTTTTAAVTSFSLFDLMDSQTGGGGAYTTLFPPRIMAHQVIDAYHHQQQQQQHDGGNSNNSNNNNSSNDDTTIQSTSNNKLIISSSAIELLEQAEDMEDLSPDVESWEYIRSIILYRGLMITNSKEKDNNNDVEGGVQQQRWRYLKVHKLLFDKCRGGGGGGEIIMSMFRNQTWGLTFNIVGFILSLSNELFDDNNKNEKMITIMQDDDDLDLYWDSCCYLLYSLSHLAMEYVTSCVGYEKEMERMLLGLMNILCKDVSACVLAMMEPMAGWFEVWARFVGPSKLLAILRVSGLGRVVLRRCECRGRNEASKRLYENLLPRRRVGRRSSESPTLQDLENSNFLHSLSIIRVITSRCNVTLESMRWIFCGNATLSSSSFLSVDGIASSDEVQTMLEKSGNDEMEDVKEQQSSLIVMQKEITARVLKPFRDVLLLNETTPGLVDANLEELCTQTVSLIEQCGC
jgi:hypothetical protein